MTTLTRSRDLVSLADRLQALQLVRLALGCSLIATLFVTDVSGHVRASVVVAAVAYGVVTSAVEIGRRRTRVRGLFVVTALLLVDAVLLTLAVTVTGGPSSPAVYLALVSVVATVLLLGSRAGLQLALWYAFLLGAAHTVALTGALGGHPLRAEKLSPARPGLNAAMLLVVAAIAAACTAINERALRRRRAELTGLVQLGYELSSAREPDEVVRYLVRHARRLDFRRAAAVAYVQDSAVAAVDASGHCETFDMTGMPRGIRTTDGEPRLVRTLDADDPLAAFLPDATNVVVIELAVDARPIGVLAAEMAANRSRVPAATVSALVESASHGALALHNAQLRREVERLATHDPLTNLANRRSFDEALRREGERHARNGVPYALALLDVDHFKRVNYTFGHQVGDKVLAEVGDALRDACRDADLPARYGGEEFVVLLSDCGDPDRALAILERLRHAVARAVTAVPITLSAGIACVPYHADAPDELLRAADGALYEAKRAGRDRCAIAKRRPTGRAEHVATEQVRAATDSIVR